MKKKPKIFIFLAILGGLLLTSAWPAAAATTNPITYDITVSAAIGEPKLTVFGFTSPQALVKMEGNRVYEETTANQWGFFIFRKVFLPRPNPFYPEICLLAIDTQGRTSFPVCLPPLPPAPFDFIIGPILLPPTLSLSQGKFPAGQQTSCQGATIPNSKVTIFLANTQPGKTALARPVLAYNLPQYQIQADEQGLFEFNLPTEKPDRWQVFASSTRLGSPTPKSNTLTFQILSWWGWFWWQIKQLLILLLGLLKPFWWPIIITIQIIIIAGLVLKRKKEKYIKTNLFFD